MDLTGISFSWQSYCFAANCPLRCHSYYTGCPFATPVLNSWDYLFTGYGYILVLFIQMLGYFSIALLIIVLTRNIALTIVIYLLYFAIIEPMLRLFLPDAASQLMPVKVISNLTPMPDFLGIMAKQFNINNQLDTSTMNAIETINNIPSLSQI